MVLWRTIKSDLLKESETMDFMDLCKSMRIVDGTPEYMKPLNDYTGETKYKKSKIYNK